MQKRFFKSTKDKKLCGVCGGIAQYFNIDPTVVRFLWALICLAYGSGIILYIILAIVMPDDYNV